MKKIEKNINLTADFKTPTYEEWKNAALQLLKGKPFDKIMLTDTYEDILIKPIYNQDDWQANEALPGRPGSLRGARPKGYRQNSWRILQKSDAANSFVFNEQTKEALTNGQNAVYLKVGEKGLNDFSIFNQQDLTTALKEIDVEKYPVYIDAGLSSVPLMAMFLNELEAQKVDMEKVSGALFFDPLGILTKQGEFPGGLENAFSSLSELIDPLSQKLPKFRLISVSSVHWLNSGANAVQELAFNLAASAFYIRTFLENHISIDKIAAKLFITFGIGGNFFMEAAKFRAIKPLYYKMMEAFGASENNRKVKLHAETGNWNKTKTDPYVNMLRITTEAFSAVLGGVDALTINPFDHISCGSTAFSRRVSRNLHYVLKEESNLDKIIDPAGGSWYVESLSETLSQKAWSLFQEIEKAGGMLQALKQGLPQKMVTDVRDQRLENLKTRKDKMIGNNIYANILEEKLKNENLEKNTRNQASTIKEGKPSFSLDMKLQFSAMQAAFKKGETLPAVLAKLFDPAIVTKLDEPVLESRAGTLFESLRKAADTFAVKTGSRPKVFLSNMGNLKEYKARADFSTGFFELAGFSVIHNAGFSDNEKALAEFEKTEAKVMVICSTDEKYPAFVEALAQKIKQKNTETHIVLAGWPKDHIDAFTKAGVDTFIHLKANAYDILYNIQQKLGVI
jgi:methylmalonyl-CoA mutase